MSETFVPLISATAKVSPASFTSMSLKVLPQGIAKPANEEFKNVSLQTPADHAAENCGKPMVTLQRNGDFVSGIRIQCGCGQVIELACVY